VILAYPPERRETWPQFGTSNEGSSSLLT
jgi:hypothetical protein